MTAFCGSTYAIGCACSPGSVVATPLTRDRVVVSSPAEEGGGEVEESYESRCVGPYVTRLGP